MSAPQTYRGRPCRACGATLRYRTNRSCVSCLQRSNTGPRLPGACSAVELNTVLAIWYPEELERLGWRMHRAHIVEG